MTLVEEDDVSIEQRQRECRERWIRTARDAYRIGSITTGQYQVCIDRGNLRRWWPVVADDIDSPEERDVQEAADQLMADRLAEGRW